MGIQENLYPEDNVFERINVIFRDNCFDKVQFRFPKTKKKRIRNKWSNDQKNWKNIPSKNLKIIKIIRGGEILAIGHPSIREKIENLNQMRSTWDPLFIIWESLEDLNRGLSQ